MRNGSAADVRVAAGAAPACVAVGQFAGRNPNPFPVGALVPEPDVPVVDAAPFVLVAFAALVVVLVAADVVLAPSDDDAFATHERRFLLGLVVAVVFPALF
jgi:hypothetical protein